MCSAERGFEISMMDDVYIAQTDGGGCGMVELRCRSGVRRRRSSTIPQPLRDLGPAGRPVDRRARCGVRCLEIGCVHRQRFDCTDLTSYYLSVFSEPAYYSALCCGYSTRPISATV